jgi:hypothetical protein
MNFGGFAGIGNVILLPAFAGVGAAAGCAYSGGSRPIAAGLAAAAGGAASVGVIYPAVFPDDKDSGMDPLKLAALAGVTAYAGAMLLGTGGEMGAALGAAVGAYADMAGKPI